MEWYLWILISYAIYVMVSITVSHSISDSKYGFFTTLGIYFLAFIFGIIITPFLWLISFGYFLLDENPRYKTYTIHKLTEENKIALRNMGFIEGEFVSNNNITYQGFRLGRGDIYIANDGRIGVKYLYSLSSKQEEIFEILKQLPYNEEKKVEEK